MLLQEMATLKKKKTKLLVNIYVDDAGTYLNSGHCKRIKFQKDYGNSPITRSFATMMLDGTIVANTMKGNEVSSKDIQQVRNFVTIIKKCLEVLSDAEIDIFAFLELMIPGGELATEEQLAAQEALLQEYLNTENTN